MVYIVGQVVCDMCFFFQAEDGIRDAQESRGLGDVYKRQVLRYASPRELYLIAITLLASEISSFFLYCCCKERMLCIIHH